MCNFWWFFWDARGLSWRHFKHSYLPPHTSKLCEFFFMFKIMIPRHGKKFRIFRALLNDPISTYVQNTPNEFHQSSQRWYFLKIVRFYWSFIDQMILETKILWSTPYTTGSRKVKSLVQDHPKPPYDGGGIPNLKEEVAGSIPGREISFLLDWKLARWSTASCALALACRLSVSKKKKKKKVKSSLHIDIWMVL